MTLQDLLRLGSGGTAMADQSHSIQDVLAAARQYDPNAQIVTQGDNGQQVVNYSMSALPKYADNTSYGQVDSSGRQINTPVLGTLGAASSYANPNDFWSDPNYGTVTHAGNININEKLNNAQQSASSDLLGKLMGSIVPSDRPWMVLPTAIMAGLAPAVADQFGSLASGALKMGVGGAESGGKSFDNPMSWLNLAGSGIPGLEGATPFINAGSSVLNSALHPKDPMALFRTFQQLYGLGSK